MINSAIQSRPQDLGHIKQNVQTNEVKKITGIGLITIGIVGAAILAVIAFESVVSIHGTTLLAFKASWLLSAVITFASGVFSGIHFVKN